MVKIVIIDDVLSNSLLIKGYLKSLPVDAVIFTDPAKSASTVPITWR